MKPVLEAADARRLWLDAQGLCDDPARPASVATVAKLVAKLGFVQLDSIQRIERAHHLTLGARLDGYRPESLDRLAFRKRTLFEHWTHDAALIPLEHYAHWRPRFARFEERMRKKAWFNTRLGAGNEAERVLARVLERVAREGPLRARDFARAAPRRSEGWWDWSPEKTALEFHWWTGRLAIAGREDWNKVYDLTERVHPEAHARPEPTRAEHVDWACTSALSRLGAATSGELAKFWGGLAPAEATAWCRTSEQRGALVSVEVADVAGKRRAAFAPHDFAQRLRRAAEPPARLRLLAPFDPIVRDRARLERLFGFFYRFEAFVPAPKRTYGYYVLPMLEGERFVGRIDPRIDRARAAIVIEGVWWERGIKPTRARLRELEDALGRIAARIGVSRIEFPRRRASS